MSNYAVMPIEDYKNTCDEIRKHINKTETIKSTELSNKVFEVYEAGFDNGVDAGKKEDYDEFWYNFQQGGKRTDYFCAFRQWDHNNIRPRYKVIPIDNNGVAYMFYKCQNLERVEAEYFDFSQKSKGTSDNTGYYFTFSNCKKLQEIEDIGFQAQPSTKGQYDRTFSFCSALHTIAKIRCDENATFTSAFLYCDSLQNVTFEGVIGTNINFSDSLVLSADSIRNIIGCLSDNTTGKTLTLAAEAVQSGFETQEWQNLIATKPNWTISIIGHI
jgi:hypothetical protein